MSIGDLIKRLDEQKPVILNVQYKPFVDTGSNTNKDNYAHFLVVYGYDNETEPDKTYFLFAILKIRRTRSPTRKKVLVDAWDPLRNSGFYPADPLPDPNPLIGISDTPSIPLLAYPYKVKVHFTGGINIHTDADAISEINAGLKKDEERTILAENTNKTYGMIARDQWITLSPTLHNLSIRS